MGEVFAGRYELVDPIGRGGVGAVWRAWDHRRRRYVAAKVLLQSDAHSLLRFVREQALRIDHPHVLAPTSWAADDDKVLFTMDLVAGGSLVHLVGDYGPLPPAFVCTLLDQLLAGLAAVHAEGVVHRDIKPANALLEATGTGRPRLRLSDFGIAMRLGEPRLTETNLVVGTPGYLAPEQMLGSEPDFPADLFAVGLVALYLLEGAKPDAKALIQYFADHGTPSAPQGIPEPLWQVVSTLLQPDPEARFRTATGARKALAAAAELLPEPGPDDELIEIFDQIGPLPPGFASDGPVKEGSGVRSGARSPGGVSAGEGTASSAAPPSRTGAADGTSEGRSAGGGGTGGEASGGSPGQAGQRESPSGGTTGSVSAGPAAAPAGGEWTGSGRGPVPSGATDPRRHTGSPATPSTVEPFTATPSTAPIPPGPPRPAVPGQPPPPGRPPTPAQSSAPERPAAMSDTGSFQLPPPQSTVTSSRPAPAPPQAPGIPQPPGTPQPPAPPHHHSTPHEAAHAAYAAPGSPHDPTHPLRSPLPHPPAHPGSPGLRPAEASTAEYTAEAPRVPLSGAAMPRHAATTRRRPRPGPPAKVAVPLLLFALACYALGFWALTQI